MCISKFHPDRLQLPDWENAGAPRWRVIPMPTYGGEANWRVCLQAYKLLVGLD
jgi:hypothetical protein